MKFREWLANQQEREDNIGFLARVLVGKEAEIKSSKRKSDEHKYWVDIVTRMGRPSYNYVFNAAWQEYLDDNETAEEGSE